MFVSASQPLPPTPSPQTPLLSILHPPRGSSSRPPGRNLLRFTATCSMLDIHKPRLHTTVQRRHTHIRSPSRFVKSEIEEILLGWISKWALIEFSSVSLCDIVCPNVAAFGTKMDGLAWKRLFQRPLLLFCLNINATLRFWSHTARLYGVWYQRTKVIAQGEVSY